MNNILKHKKSSANDYLENPFMGLQHEVSRAMNEFYDMFEPVRSSAERFENIKLLPSIDVIEDENNFKVEAELPGLGEEDITVTVSDNILTIEGEKTTSKKDEKKNYMAREITYGRYERNIPLPLSADTDKATATFKKGMLWIEIPKKSGSEGGTRKIKVKEAK